MRQALFIRHGESERNKEGRVSGQAETALTDAGKLQAIMAGTKIRHLRLPTEVYSSPLGRVTLTAYLCASTSHSMRGVDIVTHQSLIERSYGVLEGRPWQEVLSEMGADSKQLSNSPDWRPKGGESLLDVRRRTMAFWHLVAKPRMASGEIPVIFGHGGMLRAMLSYIDQNDDLTKYKIKNAEPILYTFADDCERVISIEFL